METTMAPEKRTLVPLTVKGSPAWREWIERLARAERFSLSTLVDKAVQEYARNHGFEAPPQR